MSVQVEFIYDYASPYSYLAAFRLSDFLADLDVEIVHIPVFLRGFELFREKVPFPPRQLVYMMKDLERWTARQGMPFQAPAAFPVNGLYALRGDIVAAKKGLREPYFIRLFKAIWGEGADVSTPAAVARLARKVGLDEGEFLHHVESEKVKEKLKKNTAYAEAKGVFGVPSFFVEDELFWGNDRLDFVREEALKHL